jgi:hypothetical protein
MQTLILDTLETKGRDFAVLVKLVEEIFSDEKSGLTKGDVEAGLRLVTPLPIPSRILLVPSLQSYSNYVTCFSRSLSLLGVQETIE